MDLRKGLYNSIILSGATTMFPGYATRLENEIKNLYTANNLKVAKDKTIKIPINIDSREKIIKHLLSFLFSDNYAINLNNPVKRRRNINKNKKIKIFNYISDKTENMLIKVYDQINSIKNEEKELNKINSLSFQKTSKFFFQTNRPKTSKIELNPFGNLNTNNNISTKNSFFKKSLSKKYSNNLITKNSNFSIDKNSLDTKRLNSRNFEQNFMNTNENTKEESVSDLNSIVKKRTLKSAFAKTKKSNLSINNNQSKFTKTTVNKKPFKQYDIYENKGEEKLRKLKDLDIEKLFSLHKRNKLNLARFNEVYRVQMNKALKKYNPEIHLKELNKIQLNNIKVRRDMEKVKGKINKKLDDRAQGLYYKKEYLRFKEENEKDKKARSLEKKPFPILIPFNILFRDEENKKDIKVNPHGYKIRAYYDYRASCERIQKSKNTDLLEFGANLLFGHINTKDNELLLESLDELFNSLEIDPIIKYIDDIKKEEVNRDKKVENKRFKKYFPVFTETEKILKQIEERKVIKTKKLDDNNILNKIQQTKRLLKTFENDKNIPMNELND